MAASDRSRSTPRADAPRGGSIRELIARALEEARDEFAEIVQRKLEELMGEAPSVEASRPPPPRPRAPREPAAAPGGGARRKRTPESAMGELRARIVAAMPIGEPMKRSQILKSAGLDEGELTRLSNVLRKLKDEGVVEMKGERAAATYTRRG